MATIQNWPIHQLYFNNAYLHGHIDEEIYMTPPPGYTKVKEEQVWKLQKSLYGLKQAGRQWNKEFSLTLESYGFK